MGCIISVASNNEGINRQPRRFAVCLVVTGTFPSNPNGREPLTRGLWWMDEWLNRDIPVTLWPGLSNWSIARRMQRREMLQAGNASIRFFGLLFGIHMGGFWCGMRRFRKGNKLTYRVLIFGKDLTACSRLDLRDSMPGVFCLVS